MVGRNFNKGFFLLKMDNKETARRLLFLTSYQTNEGLNIIQKWFPSFDPSTNKTAYTNRNELVRSMKIPTWIMLKHVSIEFMGVINKIVARIGKVLGADNSSNPDESRFSLALDAHLGWELSITVTKETTQIKSTILIDYNFLPIRCRACLDPSHWHLLLPILAS